ncbi:hypothetical protein SAMN02800694_2976 [Luteibacter sp. UNCMF331Sha3.1]|uniref:hypothetical protein n=1 Tax=Luteibacter sp. UNCMF331Sha3.1 TaxID=1502760 RepID=UPI0008C1329C|nr:hypothetical protein [Luteibacter sp. UNCMF331Sha3.1]SEN16771.1 hypothetical protein SAMN02800694_2976 [Luteibacter sp. UNCMF331Sha3.1]
MHVARIVLATLLAALPVVAFAADRQPLASSALFTVVNAAFDSVTALEVADAGSGAWRDVSLGEPLPGGLTSATVHLPAGACLRSFRVTFHDGRSSTFDGVDVCRAHGLRLSARPGF